MTQIFHPLLAMIASATNNELAKYVEYLKEENKILRARIPGQIHTKPEERQRLLKFGKVIGRAIEELMTIVSPATFYRWVRDEKIDKGKPKNPKGGLSPEADSSSCIGDCRMTTLHRRGVIPAAQLLSGRNINMKIKIGISLVAVAALILAIVSQESEACSRLLYKTGTGTYIVGRSMDWNDPTAETSLWVFPQGMQRDGGIGSNPIRWTSKYGSVVASFYDAATADGMNEKGLVGNVLYLAESDYGDPAKTGKPTISIGAWLQYFLDNYATVKEAVADMQDAPFTVVAPTLPNGRAAAVHLSISDSSGDSAILEYLDGKLVIHHGPQYRVMTNSPTYDQQLALNAYWDLIGGDKALPGTISAADRFVRLSYNLKSSPKFKDREMAVASVFSQIRAISVPLGMSDPDHPNISSTLWRTVADHDSRRYYFESAILPAVFWIDLSKVDLKPGASPKTIAIERGKPLAGEVSAHFKEARPFEWLKPAKK